MLGDRWGGGDQADAPPLDTVWIGEDNPRPADLIEGEQAHSGTRNSQYARTADGSVHAFDGHRRLIDVRIRSYNYLGESDFSASRVRKGVEITIGCDGEQVYQAFARDPAEALLKAHALLGQLEGHAADWLCKHQRDRLAGRPVYYREVPAVITAVLVAQGAVVLRTADGRPFPPPVYQGPGEDDEPHTSLKVDVLCPLLWWWRDA